LDCTVLLGYDQKKYWHAIKFESEIYIVHSSVRDFVEGSLQTQLSRHARLKKRLLLMGLHFAPRCGYNNI